MNKALPLKAMDSAMLRRMSHSEAESATVTRARTVVCSPHFDDAVLNCWSVLDRDESCAVVNVFTGAPRFTSWGDRRNGAPSSAAQMHQRALEDGEALAVAGKTAINLGMLEVQYRLRKNPLLHMGPLRLLSATLKGMPLLRSAVVRLPFVRPMLYATPAPEAEQIAEAILQAVPGASIFCVPAGIGGHRDHLLVREAGAVLASRGLTVRLYADLPYAVIHGWPLWIVAPEGERTTDGASALWARHLQAMRPQLGEPIKEARVVGLTPEERARKAEAVRRYTTQVATIDAELARGGLDEDSAYAHEVYWELQPRAGGTSRRSC